MKAINILFTYSSLIIVVVSTKSEVISQLYE